MTMIKRVNDGLFSTRGNAARAARIKLRQQLGQEFEPQEGEDYRVDKKRRWAVMGWGYEFVITNPNAARETMDRKSG